MKMDLVSTPEKLEALNIAIGYLNEIHTSGSAIKPDVSDDYMAAAMKVWLDRRAHIAQNINADFKDLAKAEPNSERAQQLKSNLIDRITAYNGVCLEGHLASAEAALSRTPKEGWLFERPPSHWRMEAKKLKHFKPIDRKNLFFHGRVSPYTVCLSGISKIEGNSLFLGTFVSNISIFLIYAFYYAVTWHPVKAAFFTVGLVFNLGIVGKLLLSMGSKKDE